jgi:hypothetical protein
VAGQLSIIFHLKYRFHSSLTDELTCCRVGYAGLGAGVHASGEKYQEKSITKAGRKELRWALVEAACAEGGSSQRSLLESSVYSLEKTDACK